MQDERPSPMARSLASYKPHWTVANTTEAVAMARIPRSNRGARSNHGETHAIAYIARAAVGPLMATYLRMLHTEGSSSWQM